MFYDLLKYRLHRIDNNFAYKFMRSINRIKHLGETGSI
jgi:hypothetical protein